MDDEQQSGMNFSDFLTSSAMGRRCLIRAADLEAVSILPEAQVGSRAQLCWHLKSPVIQRQCLACKQPQPMELGHRNLPVLQMASKFPSTTFHALTFRCRACNSAKCVSVRVDAVPSQENVPPDFAIPTVHVAIFGESPSRALEQRWPPTFMRRLSEQDRELLNKGRGCEIHGAGVGAMAYYRRAIENNWKLLLEEIIRSAEGLRLGEDRIQELRDAANNWQFKSSVEQVEHLIPESVFVDGKNPITLLYKQVSADLHGASDEKCLTRAGVVRLVLVHLLERLREAREAHDELREGLSKLRED